MPCSRTSDRVARARAEKLNLPVCVRRGLGNARATVNKGGQAGAAHLDRRTSGRLPASPASLEPLAFPDAAPAWQESTFVRARSGPIGAQAPARTSFWVKSTFVRPYKRRFLPRTRGANVGVAWKAGHRSQGGVLLAGWGTARRAGHPTSYSTRAVAAHVPFRAVGPHPSPSPFARLAKKEKGTVPFSPFPCAICAIWGYARPSLGVPLGNL